jgi:hypothetical protein
MTDPALYYCTRSTKPGAHVVEGIHERRGGGWQDVDAESIRRRQRPVQTEPFGQDTLKVVKSPFTRMRAKARPCLARPTAWTPRKLHEAVRPLLAVRAAVKDELVILRITSASSLRDEEPRLARRVDLIGHC